MGKTRIALDRAIIKPKIWGLAQRTNELARPWYGLDTERDAKTGDFVCGFATNPNVTLRFNLMSDLPPGTYWIWNIQYDIEGMIRDYGIDEGWAARKDGSPFILNGARCVYFHGKRFNYSDEKGLRSFIEASSFFGRAPLPDIAKEYLGEYKDPVDAKTMSHARYQSDLEYREAVDRYCIKDARLAFDLIKLVDRGIFEARGILGATPGATARSFLSRLGAFPEDIWACHRPFLRSYCGGRFEITKRGFFERAYQYDIVSAYPWALSNCPFLTDSMRYESTTGISDNALYGSYLVSYKHDDYLGIGPTWRGQTRVYSSAEKEVWLARPEALWLHEHGYDLTIHRALEIFDENATDAWARMIAPLFAQKRAGGALGLGAKIVLNSMYGILIQLTPESGYWISRDELTDELEVYDMAGDLVLVGASKSFKAGKYYAPIYSGHLTALVRVHLLNAALEAPESYIGGHTDSVLSCKPLSSRFIGDKSQLGAFVLEGKADELIITKTGSYALGGKVKTRGIGRKLTRETLLADSHVRNTRCGLKQATSWNQVSVIAPKPIINNLDIELKREWLGGKFSRKIVDRREFVDSKALRYVTV